MCAWICPALPAHVYRADNVGTVSIAAVDTPKQRLLRTVSFVRAAARRTLAARISGIHGNHVAAVFILLPFKGLPQGKKVCPQNRSVQAGFLFDVVAGFGCVANFVSGKFFQEQSN